MIEFSSVFNMKPNSHSIRVLTIILCFYRIFGTTFGGLAVDSNGKFYTSRKWSIYGKLCLLLIPATHIICAGLMINSKRLEQMYQDKDHLAHLAALFKFFPQFLHFLLVFALIHRSDDQIIKCLQGLGLNITTKHKVLFVLWVVQISYLIISQLYQMVLYFRSEAFNFTTVYLVTFKISCDFMFWMVPYLTWVISMHAYEQLKITKCKFETFIKQEEKQFCVKPSIIGTGFNSEYRIKDLKDSYLKVREYITELDESLSYVMIVDIIQTIFQIMLSIWAFALATTHPSLQKLSNQFVFNAISSTFKLLITCSVNGLVYEESDAIHRVLDRISADSLNEMDYKELVLLKSISMEQNIGFTVGGFAPLRKCTLIQVSNDQD